MNAITQPKRYVLESTEEEISFSNWEDGQPDNAMGDGGYLYLGEHWIVCNTESKKWRDVTPDKNYNVICDRSSSK